MNWLGWIIGSLFVVLLMGSLLVDAIRWLHRRDQFEAQMRAIKHGHRRPTYWDNLRATIAPDIPEPDLETIAALQQSMNTWLGVVMGTGQDTGSPEAHPARPHITYSPVCWDACGRPEVGHDHAPWCLNYDRRKTR